VTATVAKFGPDHVEWLIVRDIKEDFPPASSRSPGMLKTLVVTMMARSLPIRLLQRKLRERYDR
jgi:hypothetical protein